MKFKTFSALALAGLMAFSTAMAGPSSPADQKWSKVVEQMIVDGAKSISTPKKSRVEIAQKLAKKHGKKCKVVKQGDNYRVNFI